MKKTIAILLMVIGGGIVVFGAFTSLQALSGLYSGALADPLNQPENTEKKTQAQMLRGVYIGAPGIPLLIVGKIMLVSARRRSRA